MGPFLSMKKLADNIEWANYFSYAADDNEWDYC